MEAERGTAKMTVVEFASVKATEVSLFSFPFWQVALIILIFLDLDPLFCWRQYLGSRAHTIITPWKNDGFYDTLDFESLLSLPDLISLLFLSCHRCGNQSLLKDAMGWVTNKGFGQWILNESCHYWQILTVLLSPEIDNWELGRRAAGRHMSTVKPPKCFTVLKEEDPIFKFQLKISLRFVYMSFSKDHMNSHLDIAVESWTTCLWLFQICNAVQPATHHFFTDNASRQLLAT